MGIKNLLSYLRKLNSGIVQECDITDMKGSKIAFDLAISCYQKKSEAVRIQVKELTDPLYDDPDYMWCRMYMIKRILETLGSVIEGGCIPIAVFDGTAPDLKAGTKDMRAGKSNSKRTNISELRRIGRSLLEDPTYKMSKEDVAFIQRFQTQFVKKHGKSISSLDDIRSLIRNELNQLVRISSEDYILLGDIFTQLCIPHVYAESEAEQTCAHMCVNKDVIAMYTTDSDCLVYGCPIMINKITYRAGARMKGTVKFQCYTFANVLQVAGMTHQQFIDFCILMGTDFNDNVPGYGPDKHFKFIHKYKSFDNIVKVRKELQTRPIQTLDKDEKLLLNYDTSNINYTAVRDFFCSPVSYDKSRMEIRMEDADFESIIPKMIKLIGDEYFLTILNACRKIVDGLLILSQISK